MSETNLEQFREVTPAGRFTLQNSAMLKVRLEGDQIQAKLGSMVAYQGDVRFEYQSGGLGRFFKKALTGEGVKLMAVVGTGDMFLAQDKRKIMILDLENERMTVNGDNVLAFEPSIDWDIHRVEGAGRLSGGLFNVVLQGPVRSPSPRMGSRSSWTQPSQPSPTPTRRSPGAATSAPASGATSRSRPSPAAVPGRRSRCPSKAPAGSSYSPPKARRCQSTPTRAREAAGAVSARSWAATSPG